MILIALIIVSCLLLISALRGMYRAGYSQAWKEIAEVEGQAPPQLLAEIAKRAERQ